MIRVLLSKSTCLIMKFANRVIVSANRKCTWNSREIRTWKRVVLMGKRLKIIYIKILWGGKYNKYIIKFVLWDCFLDIFAVEAYTASWIEISYHIAPAFSFPSKPIRLRGLKWLSAGHSRCIYCRSLYGFVDWNRCSIISHYHKRVEAYTASLIEIGLRKKALWKQQGRSLYGFVDWNCKKSHLALM